MLLELKMPDLELAPARLRRCPRCKGVTHGHGRNKHRQVVDTQFREVEQRRFRCVGCGKTFQSRPGGLAKAARRSDRVKALGIILYVLGLSYRGTAKVMCKVAGKGSYATIYRDVERAGRKAAEFHQGLRGKVRAIGVDGTGQKTKGGNTGLVFAVDQDGQLLLRVEVMEEANEAQVKRFLKDLCRECGVEVVITDEHTSYKGAVEPLAVEHRLCEAHWKKSKVNRARRLLLRAKRRGREGAVKDLEQLQRYVRGWPDAEEEELKELWQKYVKYEAPSPGGRWSFGYEVRLLMQDVLENWNRVGQTNNTTERLIGLLLKIRSKTMRGFQEPENIKKFVYLTGYLWAHRKGCDLAALFN